MSTIERCTHLISLIDSIGSETHNKDVQPLSRSGEKIYETLCIM